MTMTFQEVDPDNLSTVLFDYFDITGANNATNASSVKTWMGLGSLFNLNAPQVSVDTSDRNDDGVPDLSFSYDELVQSSFSMRVQGTSYDTLRAGLGYLQRLLSSDGVIKWVPTGSTQTFYIYRKPSSIPAMFGGRDFETYKAQSLFEASMDVVLTRERLLRGPILLASVNKLQNATMIATSTVATSAGMSYWAWDSTVNITTLGYGANVNWATQSYRFQIATTGTRNLQQGSNTQSWSAAAPGDVWTFSFYVKASGGTLCKAQAILEFLSAAGAVLATASGTLTTLTNGADFTRLTITSAAAPASTAFWRVNCRFANGDATTYLVDLRRAQMEKAGAASQMRTGAEPVYNSLALGVGKVAVIYNAGDASALTRLTLAPVAGAKAVAWNLARRSEGSDVNLAESVNPMGAASTTYRAWTAVIDRTMYGGTSGDTSSTADSGATNANAAKTTFTNQASLVRRWRWVSTPTDPEALHGRWQVYAAVRPEAGTTFKVQMRWQAANRDPVTEVGDVIYLDTTDVTTSVYTPLRLGAVTFDANAGDTSLTIEGWASQDSGSGALWWDVAYLIPADESLGDQHSLLQVPGFRVGDQGTEAWLGSELTTQSAGAPDAAVASVSKTKMVMDTRYEVVGMPPASATTGGLVFAAGRHVGTATVQVQNNAGSVVTMGYLRARKARGVGSTVRTWANGVTSLGGETIAVGMIVRPTNANRNGRTYICTSVSGTHTTGGSEPTWPTTNGGTVTDNAGANQIVWTETTVASRALTSKSGFTYTKLVKEVHFDADGSTAYEFVVVADPGGAMTATQKLHVLRLKHTTLRTVDDTYAMQMLGDLQVLQTANGAVSIDELVKQGPFITLGPGTSVLWADIWALAPLAYDDMDPRDPLAKHDPSLSTTLSVDLIPRYYG